MKAITIQQPYAELIARNEKRVENRTWQTHYRGPIAIHAGKSCAGLDAIDFYPDPDRPLDFGAIIATAELVACVRHEELLVIGSMLGCDDLANDPHATGPWCWVLANVRRLPRPIPITGRQGLWEWSGEA